MDMWERLLQDDPLDNPPAVVPVVVSGSPPAIALAGNDAPLRGRTVLTTMLDVAQFTDSEHPLPVGSMVLTREVGGVPIYSIGSTDVVGHTPRGLEVIGDGMPSSYAFYISSGHGLSIAFVYRPYFQRHRAMDSRHLTELHAYLTPLGFDEEMEACFSPPAHRTETSIHQVLTGLGFVTDADFDAFMRGPR